MPQNRRKFSPQFKAEAVQMVLETDKSIAEVARDPQINEGTLGNRVNAWRRDHPEPEPELTPTEQARVAEMQEEEIRRLRMENQFLKKSSGLLCPEAGLSEKSALIEAEKANYPIAWMCQMLRSASVELLRLARARPRRDRDRGATSAAGRAGPTRVRRAAADRGLSSDRGPAQRRGPPVQRRPGRRHHA
jgi:transposase